MDSTNPHFFTFILTSILFSCVIFVIICICCIKKIRKIQRNNIKKQNKKMAMMMQINNQKIFDNEKKKSQSYEKDLKPLSVRNLDLDNDSSTSSSDDDTNTNNAENILKQKQLNVLERGVEIPL